jgi:hypothetical protein
MSRHLTAGFAAAPVRTGTQKGTMPRVWVLDTSTKGTGATMVPLESVLRKSSGQAEPIYVPPPPRPQDSPAAEPPRPWSFKVLDIMTQAVLVEDGSARETIEALNQVRSIVDVNVYAREAKTGRWRLLPLQEQRLLWGYRDAT